MIDLQDWRNPRLVIRPAGVEVIANGLASGLSVSVRDLERTLIELPLSAWPYGRVVGVVDIGLREAGDDGQLIAENRKMALAILQALKVTAERWPGS